MFERSGHYPFIEEAPLFLKTMEDLLKYNQLSTVVGSDCSGEWRSFRCKLTSAIILDHFLLPGLPVGCPEASWAF